MRLWGGEYPTLCMGVVPAASRWHSAVECLHDKAHHQWLELGSCWDDGTFLCCFFMVKAKQSTFDIWDFQNSRNTVGLWYITYCVFAECKFFFFFFSISRYGSISAIQIHGF